MTFQPGKKKIAVEITVMGKKQAEEELRPIRNARVILRRLDDTNSEKKRKTNNNGLAKMRITPGRIRVQVWAEGYEIWGEDQDLPAETEAKKEIKVVLIRSQ